MFLITYYLIISLIEVKVRWKIGITEYTFKINTYSIVTILNTIK